MTVKIKKVKDNAKIPKRATNGSAGMDLYACIDKKITIFFLLQCKYYNTL